MEEPNLSPSDVDRAIAWVKDHWPIPRTCEVCGTTDWHLSNVLASLVVMDRHHSMHLGAGVPCIVLVCKKCGNTKLFNALTTGLMQPKNEGGITDGT